MILGQTVLIPFPAFGQVRLRPLQLLLGVSQLLTSVPDLAVQGILAVIVVRPAVIQLFPGVSQFCLGVG